MLHADVAFVASPDMTADRNEVAIPENSVYVNPSSSSGRLVQGLKRMSWRIPLTGDVFSRTDPRRCRVLSAASDNLGPLEGRAETVIRCWIKLGSLDAAVVAAWDAAPKHVSTIYQLGPALLEIWTEMLVRASLLAEQVSVGQDRILGELQSLRQQIRSFTPPVRADAIAQTLVSPLRFEDDVAHAVAVWAERHPNPDLPLLAVGRRSFTPKELATEIRQRTRFGCQLSERIIRLAAQRILGKASDV
jgi:hypothetical protein